MTLNSPTQVQIPTGAATNAAQMGSLSPRTGLKDALNETILFPHRHRQIIRVVSENLTGLIYVQGASSINAARTSENEVVLEGVEAIRRMMSLKNGFYDVIAVEKEALIRKLKQTLCIDIRSLLVLCSKYPDKDLREVFEYMVLNQSVLKVAVAEESTTVAVEAFSEVVMPAGQALRFTPQLPLRDLSGNAQFMVDQSSSGDPLVEPERLVRISTVERYRAHTTERVRLTLSPPSVATPADRCKTIFEVLSHVYGDTTASL